MKNINEKELTNYILKRLQEGYFDEFEFDKDAMQAAMADIKKDPTAGEFEELGSSKFEKDPKFKEKFKSSLNRANLELPSDEAEVARLAKMVNDRNAHEKRFGKGSLNESDMTQEAYEASRYMFFSNLEQIRRQAGLLLDMDEEKLQEILENGHDWAQDHIATAKESIDQVFDFLMNETNGGDMWKSVDVEDKEDEEEGGSEFDEEIEEGMGRSHMMGRGANKKPVDYPETLMREAVQDAIEEVLGKSISTLNEDEHVKLSLKDKLKLWAKGISEEKALENLNAGIPMDWPGSIEGYYATYEPSRDYSGTNEAVEEEIDESSSDSLANKHGKNAKPDASYLKVHKEGYENIIELQDNQANHVFTLLKQDGPEEAIEYLKEFHKPGTHNILSEIKKSALDKSYEKDGYTLTWNPSVGFVKLSYKTN